MSNSSYQYPLDYTWTGEEMAAVISFFNQVENFYETKVARDEFMSAYRLFKQIVPSKMQEKQLDRDFEKVSGYSAYRAIQEVSKSERQFVKHQA
ncbi:UPF0223 protein YfdD [Lactococcus hodotermopsidis]|uniref:UPF0223 protein Hs30E_10680 n=1 Tax=Pseudolactococcus hodotermopsidis TaxID=2709157 RepID=A0A6A0BFA3_9LACT|nr:UPF0223 family protein [Lactococcus hodotermopsidis]GFH42517.1 UPF0223 protein YfdD [Lactococcus hodotermopsidis]